MMSRRHFAVVIVVVVALAGVWSLRTPPRSVSPETLPSQLSDADFWHLVSDFSEPNGYFRSDNFLSNERAFQRVIPTLTNTLPSGGVYLGVGPEQNFTYIVALKPKLSFIVDIRRGNLDEHLLYKAFIEMSDDRADFLSHLFARPRPADLAANAPIDSVIAAYENVPASQELFNLNLQAAKDWLMTRHRFALTPDDLSGLEHVYSAFYEAGMNLNYSFLNGGGFGGNGAFPSYADLMTETDGEGEQRSYLASEENFRILRQLERNNAIVPLVGNFAGQKALRAVGRYLTEHHATVTAFYTSNVEMYLFQQSDDWMKFFGNVATLPVTDKSTFIRSVSNRGFRFQGTAPGARATTRLCSIADLMKSYHAGRIRGYGDVIAMSR